MENVKVESAGTNIFTCDRSMVAQQGEQIVRSFVDECHLVLTDSSFRTDLKAAQHVVTLPHQHIYLTGTLPPRCEAPLKEMLHLPANTRVIRAQTNRPELAYNVVRLESDARVEDAVARSAHVISARKKARDGRGLIFVTSVAECDRLADALGILKCHGGMDAEERKKSVARWREMVSVGDSWMVATGTLSHGIDIANVDWIIMSGVFFCLIDAVQAMARGGRVPGRRCEVIVVWARSQCSVKGEDYGLGKELNEWVMNKRECRRRGISVAMDGIAVSCADLSDAQECDICSGDTWVKDLVEGCDGAKWEVVPMNVAVDYDGEAKAQGERRQAKAGGGWKVGNRQVSQLTPSEWEPTPRNTRDSKGKGRECITDSQRNGGELTPVQAAKERRHVEKPYSRSGVSGECVGASGRAYI